MKKMGKVIRKGHGSMKGIMVLSAVGAFLYFENRIIPRFADDYPFSFIWDGKHHGNLAFGNQVYRRVRNGRELLKSQFSHFMTWSGRIPAETLNQLFLMSKDKNLFDMANAAAVPMQILLSIWMGRGRISLKDISAKLAGVMAAAYYVCTPHLPVTAIWQTGATNYSWMGILQSIFLLPYTLKSLKTTAGKKAERCLELMMIPMGLLSGWSNESGGGIALLISGFEVIKSRLRKEKCRWKTIGFISSLIGYALLMLAPGNFRRLKIEKEYSDILSDEFREKENVSPELMFTSEMRWHFLKNGFMNTMLHMLPLHLPVAAYMLKKEKKDPETAERLLGLTAASVMVPSILLFSPEFPKRAAYPAVLYGMGAAAGAWEHLDTDHIGKKYRPVFRLGKMLLFPALMLNILAMNITNADWSEQMRNAERLMKENRGKDEITVPQTVVSEFWSSIAGDRAVDKVVHIVGRYEENADDPYNKAAAAYFGVKKLKTTSGEEHPYNQKGKDGLKAQIVLPVKRFMMLFRRRGL